MDITKITKRLGKAKRRSTLSLAGAVVGVATAGVAIGYGVSRLLRGRKGQQQPAETEAAPAEAPISPEAAAKVRSVDGAAR